MASLRYDFYHFRIDSDNLFNSGRASDGITSPKLSFIYGPVAKAEY